MTSSDSLDARGAPDSLRRSVASASFATPGARERLQFAGLVSLAVPYVLDDALATALASTVGSRPGGIERNLDQLRLPPEGAWFEWDEAARSAGMQAGVAPEGGTVSSVAPGAIAPVRGGALLSPHPEDEDRVVILSAWSLPDGTVRNGYAAIAASRTDLAYGAWLARTRFSEVPRECSFRMLSHVHAYVPPGMGDEIEFLARQSGVDVEEIRRGAMRDATSDAIYVLAAAIAVGARGVEKAPDGGAFVCSPAARRGTVAERLSRRFRGVGFVRRGVNATARAEFAAPDA